MIKKNNDNKNLKIKTAQQIAGKINKIKMNKLTKSKILKIASEDDALRDGNRLFQREGPL